MTVKVSPKYQVVIPEAVRASVGIKPGMEVSVLSKGGIVYIIPVKGLRELSGQFAGKFAARDLRNYRDKKDRKV